MRVHHLNCGTMCPFGGRLTDGVSHGLGESRLVCHCLLIETERGLVLVDTGLGLQDVAQPRPRINRLFLRTLRPQLTEEETAIRQIERLGFDPKDVRHIVVTHMDFDHVGGLEDFPQATVHLHAAEARAVASPRTAIERARYSPWQWDDVQNWQRYEPGEGERWFGFQCVRDLKGLPPDILLVPLVGHTWGHSGVAIATDHGWLLHAGDAYFYRDEMKLKPYCTPGLRGYQWMMEVDRRARLANQNRLRGLAIDYRDEVRVFSAHDAVEFEALSRRAQPRPLAQEGAPYGADADVEAIRSQVSAEDIARHAPPPTTPAGPFVPPPIP